MLARVFGISKGTRLLYKKKNYSVIFSLTNFPAANRANIHFCMTEQSAHQCIPEKWL